MTTIFLGLLFIASGMAAIVVIAQSLYKSVQAGRALYRELAFIEAVDSFAAQQIERACETQSAPGEHRSMADCSLRTANAERHQRRQPATARPVIYRPIMLRKAQPPHCPAAA